MESSTKILRRLLDERGVEWSNVFTGTGDVLDNLTEWNVPNAGWVEAWEYGGHLSYTWHMGEKPSPEQAVEATLGRGTCMDFSKYVNVFECSECGFSYDFITTPRQAPRYCPNCGRKVVDE